MKRFIKVINQDMAERLENNGFKYMIEQIDDREVYVFVETDALRKLLNDKKNYSKKYWFADSVLKF